MICRAFLRNADFIGRRLTQTPYKFNRAQAARARKWMRRETAIGPTAESTPRFWKSERSEWVRRPVADERHDRNCRRRSLSLRSCARRDSHPCGRAGAIARKHSTRAPRQMPPKRKSRRMRVHDLLNARTCSLRRDLLTWVRLAQEISARSTSSKAPNSLTLERVESDFLIVARR